MKEINVFTINLLLIITIILNAISQCITVSKRIQLCYDADCSVPISEAKTLMQYNSINARILSFKVNTNVIVYSKEKGTKKGLWGVEINGKRGYAPQGFLQETKVLQQFLPFEIPMVEFDKPKDKDIDSKKKHAKKEVETPKPNPSIETPVVKHMENDVKKSLLVEKDVPSTNDAIDDTTILFNDDEPPIQPVVIPTIQTSAAINKQHLDVSVNIQTPDINKSNLDTIESKLLENNDNLLEASKVENELQPSVIKQDNAPEKPDSIVKILSKQDEKIEIDPFSDTSNTLLKEEQILEEKIIDIVNDKASEITSKIEPVLNMEHLETNVQDDQNTKEKEEELFANTNNTELLPDLQKPEQEGTLVATSKNDNSINYTNIESTADNKEEYNATDSKNDSATLKETLSNVSLSENNFASEMEPVLTTFAQNETNEDHSVPQTTSSSNEGAVSSEKNSSNANVDILEVQSAVDNVTGSTEDIRPDPRDFTKAMDDPANNTTEDNIALNITSASNQETNIDSVHTNNVVKDASSLNIASNQFYIIRNLLNVEENVRPKDVGHSNESETESAKEESGVSKTDVSTEHHTDTNNENSDLSSTTATETVTPESTLYTQLFEPQTETLENEDNNLVVEDSLTDNETEKDIFEKNEIVEDLEETTLTDTMNATAEDEKLSTVPIEENIIDACAADDCTNAESSYVEEAAEMDKIDIKQTKLNYWDSLVYIIITALTTLAFSLGYYYIENIKRDEELIAKINKLERDLLVSTKECMMLDETLKFTKTKLDTIEDEFSGTSEMLSSLKIDLEAAQKAKDELQEQVNTLEKDLENASEAGLELESMLREALTSRNNEVKPLALTVEVLQLRLNTQQSENQTLTNALNAKTQEVEALSADLMATKKRCEELEIETQQRETSSTDLISTKRRCEELETKLSQVTENLKTQISSKNNIEQTLTDCVHRLELQLNETTAEKVRLSKELKEKEEEVKDLTDVINKINTNNLDLDKLYDVSHAKAEAAALTEERDELKARLSEVESARNLLEENMKLIKEDMSTLTERCKLAEKEKKNAETRLRVLSNFFNEREEVACFEEEGEEVASIVKRMQAMRDEMQGHKQQVEMLKREILDQEREYKTQIASLEAKAHEQWIIARQNERRLEESKAEASQLRNRLTLIEKSVNDADVDAKLHRLEANGEAVPGSAPLFVGTESSSSPIMFGGPANVPPPPPPSYMHMSPLHMPPYLPPPLPNTSGVPSYEVGQRPPPLGGRLSSPPPPASGRYENAGSPPPPMLPHLLPPFFGGDHMRPPPPPPPSLLASVFGAPRTWGEETPPPLRNSNFHPHQREQRAPRNHKGSLHSSGESLDKTHHSGK